MGGANLISLALSLPVLVSLHGANLRSVSQSTEEKGREKGMDLKGKVKDIQSSH